LGRILGHEDYARAGGGVTELLIVQREVGCKGLSALISSNYPKLASPLAVAGIAWHSTVPVLSALDVQNQLAEIACTGVSLQTSYLYGLSLADASRFLFKRKIIAISSTVTLRSASVSLRPNCTF
jgi:hypothetical protein